MSEKPVRRIISPATVVRASSTASTPAKMLEDALSIIDVQIERLRVKAASAALDEREARTLLGYVKGLVEISKEEREREKSDTVAKELANLSTEKLLEMAEQKLKPGK